MGEVQQMKPKRIQLSRKKGWRKPPNTIKVDRSGNWGNPFEEGEHGTQEECVTLFTAMLRGEFASGVSVTVAEQQAYHTMAYRDRDQITGENLACWCEPGTPCHADVLLEFANATAPAAGTRSGELVHGRARARTRTSDALGAKARPGISNGGEI